HPLRVVGVHLAPEGGQVVAHGGECSGGRTRGRRRCYTRDVATHEHHQRAGDAPVAVAVVTVSDTRTEATDASGRLARARPERVPVERSAGRRLAEAVVMPVDVPGFTNSAMDGWAVRAEDAPGRLALVGEAAAGRPWAGALGAGEAARISTGAPLPEGADAVV